MHYIVIIKRLLLVVILLLICSCRLAEDLIIIDGGENYKKYQKAIDEIIITIKAKVLIGPYLTLVIKVCVENQGEKSIFYHPDHFGLESKVLNLTEYFYSGMVTDYNKNVTDSVWTVTDVQKFQNKNILIPSNNSFYFEIDCHTNELEEKQLREYWPWPKNEQIKIHLGYFKRDSTDIVLPTLYLAHKSVLK